MRFVFLFPSVTLDADIIGKCPACFSDSSPLLSSGLFFIFDIEGSLKLNLKNYIKTNKHDYVSQLGMVSVTLPFILII